MSTSATQSNPRLKFALVTETFKPEINGVAMTLGKLVENLIKKSHQIQIIRPKQSKHDTPSNSLALQEILMPGLRIPFYPQLKLGFPAKNQLIKLWQANRPDIVHIATEGPMGWSALQAARYLEIPTISSFHTHFHHYAAHYGLGLLTKPIAQYLRYFHNATLTTLVPTQKLADELRKSGYQNVELMARGVEINQFNPTKRCASLRKSWGVTEQDLVVLYVGRLAKEKNIDLLISAFAKIKLSINQAKLVFVGDGPLYKALREKCPDAIFTGNQEGESLARHYASGDLFLFPSITETYGNVVPEALASGLAVIAYNYAAAGQLITHKKNGMLVEFDHAQAFITAAQTLANDSEALNQCRIQASSSVQNLDWAKVSSLLEETLFHLINHPTSKRIKAYAKIESRLINQVSP